MRILLIFILTILLSCSNKKSENVSIKFDINEDLTFEEFKLLIENKGLEKDYPDINKWKMICISRNVSIISKRETNFYWSFILIFKG